MKSLYDSYMKKRHWKSYYEIPITPQKLFAEQEDKNHSAILCEEFIRRHFKEGYKGQALSFDFFDKYVKEGKHSHTVSLYLLGLHLEKLFAHKIRSKIRSFTPNNREWYNEKEFKYTWFLCALYHDVASCIEEQQNRRIEDLESLIKTIIPEKESILNRYSSDTVTNYLRYRADSETNDHGIIGGLLLFGKLKDAFYSNVKNHDWEKNKVYIKDGLLWRLEHIDHYRYVADSIICHNLWTAHESNKILVDKYREYGLDELIIDSEDKKLSFDKYPLHFMLCLLDSIEPVKRFKNLSPRTILKNITIELVSNKKMCRKIRISWSDNLKTDIGFWDWMKNIYSLPEWMQVRVSSCNRENDRCSLEIEIMCQ